MSVDGFKGNIDILLMSDNGLDTVGGEQESTKIIINGVKEYYSLGVIQPGNIKAPVDGVHYYPLTEETRIKHLIKNPFAFFKYIWKTRKVIIKEKPKVIHTQAQVSFFVVGLLKKIKLIPEDFQFVHTERGLYTKYSKPIKTVFHYFIKELDVLVTTTEFNMKYWKDSIKNKKLFVDCKIIENTAGELFEKYDDIFYRKNDNRLIVGFAGRYADWKNWPLAVEICESLNNQLGEQLIVNMAVGCLDYKAERETKVMFERLSSRLGNRFNGVINIDLIKMDRFYYDLDVFILTSNYNTESFGRTLVEAMSRKTVVLTTDAGGSVEVVGNKKNVCSNADDFVSQIINYYHDNDKMKQEKERSYERVRKMYSLDNNITKHLNLYQSII